jgi:hypothetical protein
MPLIAVLGRVAVDEFLLTVGKHYRKLDARQKIRRTVGFASSLRLPKVCYVQIWHAHFMNGVFQQTAIFNHRFGYGRKKLATLIRLPYSVPGGFLGQRDQYHRRIHVPNIPSAKRTASIVANSLSACQIASASHTTALLCLGGQPAN